MPEQPFPSTHWEWRRVKIASPPEARKGRAPKAGRWWFLPRWPDRKPLPMTVKFRGGSECWYEVHARGQTGRFPGTASIHDVMREVMRRP